LTRLIIADAFGIVKDFVDFKMLNHYTQFIGLDGSINKEDLLIEEDKTKIEREIEDLKKSNKVMAERMTKLLEIFKNNPEASKLIVKNDMAKMKELFAF